MRVLWEVAQPEALWLAITRWLVSPQNCPIRFRVKEWKWCRNHSESVTSLFTILATYPLTWLVDSLQIRVALHKGDFLNPHAIVLGTQSSSRWYFEKVWIVVIIGSLQFRKPCTDLFYKPPKIYSWSGNFEDENTMLMILFVFARGSFPLVLRLWANDTTYSQPPFLLLTYWASPWASLALPAVKQA